LHRFAKPDAKRNATGYIQMSSSHVGSVKDFWWSPGGVAGLGGRFGVPRWMLSERARIWEGRWSDSGVSYYYYKSYL